MSSGGRVMSRTRGDGGGYDGPGLEWSRPPRGRQRQSGPGTRLGGRREEEEEDKEGIPRGQERQTRPHEEGTRSGREEFRCSTTLCPSVPVNNLSVAPRTWEFFATPPVEVREDGGCGGFIRGGLTRWVEPGGTAGPAAGVVGAWR